MIICADFLQAPLREKSIDLIVTSPPYNVARAYSSCDDALPYTEYIKWSEKWLAKSFALAKPFGRLCVNLPLHVNIEVEKRSVYADIVAAARRIGWQYRFAAIWNKKHTSLRSAWGSWMSASAPHVVAQVEMIAVFYKDCWYRAPGVSDISKSQFVAWTNGMWEFAAERGSFHPAAFPVELPRRCIKLLSYITDVILDPFMGSGTTLIAAKEGGRKGIGIEIDQSYCRAAYNRINKEG